MRIRSEENEVNDDNVTISRDSFLLLKLKPHDLTAFWSITAVTSVREGKSYRNCLQNCQTFFYQAAKDSSDRVCRLFLAFGAFVKLVIDNILVFNREWFTLKLGMYVRNRNISLLFNIYWEEKNWSSSAKVVTNQWAPGKLRKYINVPALYQYGTK